MRHVIMGDHRQEGRSSNSRKKDAQTLHTPCLPFEEQLLRLYSGSNRHVEDALYEGPLCRMFPHLVFVGRAKNRVRVAKGKQNTLLPLYTGNSDRGRHDYFEVESWGGLLFIGVPSLYCGITPGSTAKMSTCTPSVQGTLIYISPTICSIYPLCAL